MVVLVRIDKPDVRIVGTSEQILVCYPIAPERREDGSWGWEYTGADSRVYDETAEPCLAASGDPLFQDENGEDVPLSNVAVKHGSGRLTPLKDA